MRPNRTCSSVPAANSASATSCCGNWPIPSCISPMFCGRRSGARSWMQRSTRIKSANGVLAGPVNSCRAAGSRRVKPVLKTRVFTAVILLALLLAALFALPPAVWAALIVAMVMQGAVEWSRRSGLSGGKANIYWGLTLLLMLGLLWADAGTTETQRLYLHLAVYAVSASLWLIIVPTWLMAGWKVRQPLLMALTGWAVLIPTGLAMLDLRETSPWMLLFVMCLVWAADIAAYFAGRKFGKHKLAPAISPGKTWEGVAGALLGVSVYVLLVWSFSPHFSYREMLPMLLLARS